MKPMVLQWGPGVLTPDLTISFDGHTFTVGGPGEVIGQLTVQLTNAAEHVVVTGTAAAASTAWAKVAPGRYRACVISSVVGRWAASTKCIAVARPGLSSSLIVRGARRSVHHRWQVALTAKPGMRGLRARVRWQIRRCTKCAILRTVRQTVKLRQKTVLVAPRLARRRVATLVVSTPATVVDGVPYSAGTLTTVVPKR